ncbi:MULTISPECIES: outer membrane beta-barrel protein [Polaromonas]|uniref:Outer membrane beta-barrel protein n=1 Tax=Polaromonas aquatica TaxID=332657 RepID=A0ABW1TSS3_9BURK
MKKLFVVAALASTFMASTAFAQGYIGFGIGSSRANNADGTSGGFTVSGGNSNKGSAKIYGGFQFTPNWGLEAQYSDLGNRAVLITNSTTGAAAGSGNYRASQFSIAGTGTLPIGQSFALIGKLGISANRANGSATAPFSFSSQNKSDLLVGIGVSYSITPRLAVRLEYEDFGKFTGGGNIGNTGSTRLNNTSLNLQYAF